MVFIKKIMFIMSILEVEFCGEQLFRMVELNLIDNIGEAFGFNTTSFNISDPFLSANFTGEKLVQI